MNNYFGIGLDAKISLDFNNKRDEHPEKCRWGTPCAPLPSRCPRSFRGGGFQSWGEGPRRVLRLKAGLSPDACVRRRRCSHRCGQSR